MENILFVTDSCHKCQQAIEHLNKRQIIFDVLNILDFEKVKKHKKYIQNQSLPILVVNGKVLTYLEILKL
ncbi:glutaredoxin domain-containing protein [Bacillaceae bacterium S4-13-58]